MEYPHGGLSTNPGRTAFIITIISMVLISIGLVLRIWAELISRRRFKAHDYFYFAGFVFAIGYSTQFLYGIYPNVMGMHLADEMRLYPVRLESASKIIAASSFIWAIATTLVKLSLLSFHLRIFTSKPFHWDRTIEGGYCGDSSKMQLSTAIVNMILDFLIVILPLPVLWQLQISLKRKVVLSCIFNLSICLLISCHANKHLRNELTRKILVVNQDEADTTRSIAQIGLFSILEVNVGMICASLPTLGPLFFRNSGRSGRETDSSSGKVNTFMRRRAAGQGKRSWVNEPTLSTIHHDALPLRDIGAEEGRDSGGAPAWERLRADNIINVQTDIYVT
ncbi:hypothetical protein BDV06DRAFT_229847 [Aspergillus oleicola]